MDFRNENEKYNEKRGAQCSQDIDSELSLDLRTRAFFFITVVCIRNRIICELFRLVYKPRLFFFLMNQKYCGYAQF